MGGAARLLMLTSSKVMVQPIRFSSAVRKSGIYRYPGNKRRQP
jgi:hypothetical protein